MDEEIERVNKELENLVGGYADCYYSDSNTDVSFHRCRTCAACPEG